MVFELPYRRLLILTEGRLGVFSSKTGAAVLRYRPTDCVAVLDSQHAGEPLRSILDGAPDVPIVANVADAMGLKPDAIVIGIAPVGGALPDAMRRHLVDGLGSGLSVISGLHVSLSRDPQLAELAERHGARIHDVRDPGPIQHIARGRARQMRVRRVLTVGTDCAVGKMVAALELRKEACRQGLDAAFVATGQTGILIEGWGIAVDHVISDFAPGAAELLVQHVADRQVCFVEGQGSIGHPAYSCVTLALVHGVCADAMVMCHRPGRAFHSDWHDCPIAAIERQIALYEEIAEPVHPCKVVAVAVNTVGMSPEEADRAVREAADRTGLPAADPIRQGCGDLLAAVRGRIGV